MTGDRGSRTGVEKGYFYKNYMFKTSLIIYNILPYFSKKLLLFEQYYGGVVWRCVCDSHRTNLRFDKLADLAGTVIIFAQGLLRRDGDWPGGKGYILVLGF